MNILPTFFGFCYCIRQQTSHCLVAVLSTSFLLSSPPARSPSSPQPLLLLLLLPPIPRFHPSPITCFFRLIVRRIQLHSSTPPAWPNTKTVWILSIPSQLTTMSTMSSPFFSLHPRSFPYKRIINHMGSKEAAIKFVPQRSGGRANIYNHQCVGGRGSPASRGGSPENASRKPNTAQARFRSINSRQL